MWGSHNRDHEHVGRAIAYGELARECLLVHLAREHDLKVKRVRDRELANWIVDHDEEHGVRCFEEAEASHPGEYLRDRLRSIRKRRRWED
jgi:hypothetical protein